MARALYVYPSRNRFGLTPIGISISAAVLKARGHEVQVFDTTFYDTTGLFNADKAPVAAARQEQLLFFQPVDYAASGIVQEKADVVLQLQKMITEFRPHFIAFSFWSCQLTGEEEGMMYWRGRDLLAAAGIRGMKTGIPVIAGGIFPSLNPAVVLADRVCSHVCCGEGEYVYADCADALARGEMIDGISNICTLMSDGSLRRNPLRPLADLDALPPGDFTIFNPRSFLRPFHGNIVRGVDYEFTRGCGNDCSYCVGPGLRALYSGQVYRRERSIENIIATAQTLKKELHLDLIRLQDELFLGMTADKLHALAKIYREQVDLPFIIETSVSTLTEENIDALREMGCLSVSVGIEHGNALFRSEFLNKHFDNSMAVTAFSLLRAAGIGTHAYAMMGFPCETRSLVMDTVKLLRDLRPDTFQASIFQPFYGTALWRHCIDHGMCTEQAQPQEFVRGSIVNNPAMPHTVLAGLQRVFALYVLLPEELWDEVRQAESDDGVYRRLLPLGQAAIARQSCTVAVRKA